MHELSVVQALFDEIDGIAAAHGGAAVIRVTVRCGPLSGIDGGLLAGAFAAVRSGCCHSAELKIESMPVRLRCRECGAQSTVAPNRLLCGRCNGHRTTVLSGDELLLTRVELAAGYTLCA